MCDGLPQSSNRQTVVSLPFRCEVACPRDCEVGQWGPWSSCMPLECPLFGDPPARGNNYMWMIERMRFTSEMNVQKLSKEWKNSLTYNLSIWNYRKQFLAKCEGLCWGKTLKLGKLPFVKASVGTVGFVNINQILTELSLSLLDTKKVITIGIKYEFKNCYKKCATVIISKLYNWL